MALEALKNINFIIDNPSKVTGVTTGFDRMDKYTLGWQKGELILLAARPMMGKTTVACELALNAAEAGHPVSFFSLADMSAAELAEKMILMIAGVPFVNIRDRQVTAQQRKEIERAAEKFMDLPIQIRDMRSLGSSDFSSIRSTCRKDVSAGTELIIVDYIQQIRHGDLRERALIERVSSDLKQMASLLDIPVIALSQLSRAVETRGGSKRPQLSDLRESGALEQDADGVAFVYRPEYYGITEDENGNSLRGVTEIIWGKHRKSGDPRPIILQRNPNTGRLEGEKQSWVSVHPDDRITPVTAKGDSNDYIPF